MMWIMQNNIKQEIGYERLKSLEQEKVDKTYKRGYDDAKRQ